MQLAWVRFHSGRDATKSWHLVDYDKLDQHPMPSFSTFAGQTRCRLRFSVPDYELEMAKGDIVRWHPVPICPPCLRSALALARRAQAKLAQ
jgi:hypothetical protein